MQTMQHTQPLSAAFTAAPATEPGVPGLPVGAVRMAVRYYDATGRARSSRTPVPVDEYGVLAGVEYHCRRCQVARWFRLGLKGIPACELCDRRMQPGKIRRAPLLPWRDLWDVAERPLRPVWSLPALAAAGYAVDAATIPPLAIAAAAPVVGELARRLAERREIQGKIARGRLEDDDPEGGKRLRAAIARRARTVGYTTTGAVGWLAMAAGLGVDPHTLAGKVSLVALAALAALPAATWWRKVRRERNRPAPAAEPLSLAEPTFGELIARRWTETVGAVARPAKVIPADGVLLQQPKVTTPAVPGGKLPGTILANVHRVTGGWAAMIIDPHARGLDFTGEHGGNIRRNIAGAFSVGIAAVSLEPETDDANRCRVMVQPRSPLRDEVRWDGPSSVDAEKGTGMAGRYADGATMYYEVYRPGWGCPHDALFGTTGSGKSEMFCQLMTIDRWMHYTDFRGRAHGMVADFLIDPQHGQSFGPFLDDLAAPVASSLDEAMWLVSALEREGLRRNEYLAEAPWVDSHDRPRKGRKFWDPFIDGPMLVLNIDEAHYFLAYKPFTELITAAARMWRKCGLKVRIGTHTPLLTDLGGSMALRDMLTGGFVWVGRTANSLSGPTAFNGQLPVDPRSIPKIPGMGYAIAGQHPRTLLMRSAYEPDYYDWVRDADNQPIGFPAALPQITLDTFGPEFTRWRTTGELIIPAAAKTKTTAGTAAPAQSASDPRCLDAVLLVLAAATDPLDTDQLDGELRRHNFEFAARTIREALAAMRKAEPPLLETVGGRHLLTQRGIEEAMTRAELVNA